MHGPGCSLSLIEKRDFSKVLMEGRFAWIWHVPEVLLAEASRLGLMVPGWIDRQQESAPYFVSVTESQAVDSSVIWYPVTLNCQHLKLQNSGVLNRPAGA